MVEIDSRLLDATCVENLEENFNRVLALIDAISGPEGTVAAITARVEALDGEEGAIAALSARIAALEPEEGSGSAET